MVNMDLGDQPTFRTKEEEIRYWKDLSQRLFLEKENVQREFDDYTADSQQLEKEYEATIDQHEKTIKDLRTANNKMQNELENLRLKLEQNTHENSLLQSELTVARNEKTQVQNYIRELEQKNDDLERAERIVSESVAAIQASLNLAIERNAMLESEVDEKETLKEKLQRLADESRDLKQELQVKERCPDNERVLNGCATPPVDNRLKVEHETQTTPFKRDPNLNSIESPISPSSRIVALNLVGDLLRKVGLSRFLCDQCGRIKCTVCPTNTNNPSSPQNLEAKLGHCRNGYRERAPTDIRSHHSRATPSPSLQGFKK